jgi:plasmid stability protein
MMASMKNVQIRNVPERVHKVLRRRAAEAGQSLQEYLMQLLEESASQLTMDEWLERVEKLPKSKFAPGEVARIIREERDKRDAEIARRADRS